MLSGNYLELYNRLSGIIPEQRLIHDDLRTLAFGTDASFYRLIPKLVVKVESEQDVIHVLKEARSLKLPLTFRAAGTSLSGQAISDSVLVMLGSSWTRRSINAGATQITLQPGVIGGHANASLSAYKKKIGPDPASINSCMIGGIAANNSSGMCCGTAQNSYNTMAGIRIILFDGVVLDTRDPVSRHHFLDTHVEMISRIKQLSDRAKHDQQLAARIRRKFKMKNTTGYSLNALVDFDDPIDIIQHLMIGSEGTLGFIAEVTYNTVPDLPYKASSLMLFPDIETACNAVSILKNATVDAVEIMDRASLRSVENREGMPSMLKRLDERVAALLVETRSEDPAAIALQTEGIKNALQSLTTLVPITFTSDVAEYTLLWNIRKGLFPSVGAMRATGTTVIIEDVVFPVPRLAEGTLELQSLFRRHGYDSAIIFGHALEGNLHFVFSQDFNTESEVRRYAAFMQELCEMVVKKYDGSLKAEHGTGRNMAPFVELEWGAEAYALMKEIKGIFDPENLLNPGVILSEDRHAHISNLKPLPIAHPVVDKCVECGFCEVHCPSKHLTITPRQRIVAYREIQRLMATHGDAARLASLQSSYEYYGDRSCATDGLCATNCPVGIDTGKLIKDLRSRNTSPFARGIASLIAHNMTFTVMGLKLLLNTLHITHKVFGTEFMAAASAIVRRFSGNKLPAWNKCMPKGARRLPRLEHSASSQPTVVYFPSCINRAMGNATNDDDETPLPATIVSLLKMSGHGVVYPEGISNLCCGMAFASKGFKEIGDMKAKELEQALLHTSRNGSYPVLIDMSPCAYRMKEAFTSSLKVFEPVRFLNEFVIDKLDLRKVSEPIAIHTTCSARKMGLETEFVKLANRCAKKVIVPETVGCCGWAGDRGFTLPELAESALKDLRGSIPPECGHGYSTSRTCEIGLSLYSDIPYHSIVSLVEKCTRPAP